MNKDLIKPETELPLEAPAAPVVAPVTAAIEKPASKASAEKLMDFSDWFTTRLKSNNKLKVHHHNAILAYFRDKGLSEKESAAKFDSMLKIFGF